jgi:hypothetical protein
MKTFELEIPVGIGDNIYTRIYLDSVKHKFDQIRISHSKETIDYWRGGDPTYIKFLNEIGQMLFTERPYVFDGKRCNQSLVDKTKVKIMAGLGVKPKTPKLDMLCKGTSLNLNEPYIVLTTKVRCLPRARFFSVAKRLWEVLKPLTAKYKVVVLGERKVELSREYFTQQHTTYGMYGDIIKNLPAERVVDLTVPALGIVVPDLDKVKQDCLIMKEAEAVITLGIGGNFWMALAVSKNVVGFRDDQDIITDLINNPGFHTAHITKDLEAFIQSVGKL